MHFKPKWKLLKLVPKGKLADWNFPYKDTEVNWNKFKEGQHLVSVLRDT